MTCISIFFQILKFVQHFHHFSHFLNSCIFLSLLMPRYTNLYFCYSKTSSWNAIISSLSPFSSLHPHPQYQAAGNSLTPWKIFWNYTGFSFTFFYPPFFLSIVFEDAMHKDVPVCSFWVVYRVWLRPATFWRTVLEEQRRIQVSSWEPLKLLLNLIVFSINSSNLLFPLLWRHLYFWCILIFTSCYPSEGRRLNVSTSLSTWFSLKTCFSMTIVVSSSHDANQRSLDTSKDAENWFWWTFKSYKKTNVEHVERLCSLFLGQISQYEAYISCFVVSDNDGFLGLSKLMPYNFYFSYCLQWNLRKESKVKMSLALWPKVRISILERLLLAVERRVDVRKLRAEKRKWEKYNIMTGPGVMKYEFRL